DIVVDLPVNLRGGGSSTPGYHLATYTSMLSLVVDLYKESGPLTHDRLREAASLAIDPDAIVSRLLGGSGNGAVRATSVLRDRFSIGSPALKPHIAHARELVSAMGGTPEVTVNFPTDRYVGAAEIGEALAGMLESAGFKIKRNPMPGADLLLARTKQQLTGVT